MYMLSIFASFMILGSVSAWNQRDSTPFRNRFVPTMKRSHSEFMAKFPPTPNTDVSSFPILFDEINKQVLSIYWNFTDLSEKLISFDVLNGGKTTLSKAFPSNFSRLNENRPVLDSNRDFMYLPRIFNNKIWYVLKIDISKSYETFGKVNVLTNTASETQIVDLAIDNSILYVSYKDRVSAFDMNSSNGPLLWTVFNYDQNTVEFGTILLTNSSIFVSNIQRSPSQLSPFYIGMIRVNRMGTVTHRTAYNPSLATRTPTLTNDLVNLDGGFILTSHLTGNMTIHLTLFHEKDITHPFSLLELRMQKYMKNLQRFECSNILAFSQSNNDDNTLSLLCNLSETELLTNPLTILFKFALINGISLKITEENLYDSPRFFICNTQLVTLKHGGSGNDNGDNFNGDYYGFVCDYSLIIYSQSGDGEASDRIRLDTNVSAYRDLIGAANGMFYLMNDYYLESLRHNIE